MRLALARSTLAGLRVVLLLIVVIVPGQQSAPWPALAPPATPAATPPPTAPPATPTVTPPQTATPPPAPTSAPLAWSADDEVPYTPILMYHYIREVDEEADPLGFRLSVRPDRFEEQLAWLRDNGYRGLRMRELAACLRSVEGCPPRVVALTFDDGYADNAEVALPLLERYGFPATFFIVTGLVGREGYMTWDDLERLRDSGMEIGAHTVGHVDLTALSMEEARAEIAVSRLALEERLGIAVVSFSYPAGNHSPEVRAMVREAGFTSAVVVAPADRPVQLDALPRRRVLGGETIEGYPWYFVPPSLIQ